MPGLIQANIACDRPKLDETFRATCSEMIERSVPNLFRLYLNPHVAQACFCLTEMIAEAWPGAAEQTFRVFLANGMEEALSGAIKLARYASNAEGRSCTGIVIDPNERLKHFAATQLRGRGRIEFIPSLYVVAGAKEALAVADRRPSPPGFVCVFGNWLRQLSEEDRHAFERFTRGTDRPLLIVCTDSESLDGHGKRVPDIVVFDESFVGRQVPFGAFAAGRGLFDYWSRRGMTLFHSTTFQPNTISTLQLVNWLRRTQPDFITRHATALAHIADDFTVRRRVFGGRYNRSLARLIRRVGWHRTEIKAAGHYVEIGGRRVFDGVAGVACSVRGHNPPNYLTVLERLGDLDACREELTSRLFDLTGLSHVTPAVSGASAVEHALKIGLAAQCPRSHVLVMRGGFGGKTLFALTGTWKASLREGLDPLFPHVCYVDPFADGAAAAVEAAFASHPIGVVQCEPVQGVGGVRALPDDVLCCLTRMRGKYDCLLFVDEVQTGVYRTGPFVRSTQLSIRPDLLTIGKAVSDMMFPFAITLHSDAVEQRLAGCHSDLTTVLRSKYDYELGLRTALNVLRYAEERQLTAAVEGRGEQFERLLKAKLRNCRQVRDVRVFGLLIGIELATAAPRWLSQLRRQLLLLAMLRHPRMPLLVGYCQYEPHVLKLTPPLTITGDEVERVCDSIATVLTMPTWRAAWKGLMPSSNQLT